MVEADVPAVHALLTDYLSRKKYELHHVMKEDEVRHWLLPIKDVVYSYVVEVCSSG